MSSVRVDSQSVTASPPVAAGEVRLEVVVLPVSDVDRAKEFYANLGWRLDADIRAVTICGWCSSHLQAPGAPFNLARTSRRLRPVRP